MDLIAGLEGETINDFKNSVDTAINLRPDNITVHTLCLKKGFGAERERRLFKRKRRFGDGGIRA